MVHKQFVHIVLQVMPVTSYYLQVQSDLAIHDGWTLGVDSVWKNISSLVVESYLRERDVGIYVHKTLKLSKQLDLDKAAFKTTSGEDIQQVMLGTMSACNKSHLEMIVVA